MEEVSGLDAVGWVMEGHSPARHGAVARADAMAARRAAGEPLQYVLGRWGFRTLDLLVDRRVLIPRPETEVVVDAALEALAALAPPRLAVDLGTGSGAIALSLAAESPLGSVEVWATDDHADALDVASANLAGVGRAAAAVRMAQGSWFEALPDDLRGRISLVVSNPPYVAEGDDVEDGVAGWEPTGALYAGPAGTEAIERILVDAPAWLATPGVVVLEIGASQGDAVRAAAERLGYTGVEVRRDLVGRDRILIARRS